MKERILKTTWPKKFQTVAVKPLSRGKAMSGIHQIVEEFDSSVGIHKTSMQHTTRYLLRDEIEMVSSLLQLNPSWCRRHRIHVCHNVSSVGIHKTSLQHTTRYLLRDEKEMVSNLLQLNPS